MALSDSFLHWESEIVRSDKITDPAIISVREQTKKLLLIIKTLTYVYYFISINFYLVIFYIINFKSADVRHRITRFESIQFQSLLFHRLHFPSIERMRKKKSPLGKLKTAAVINFKHHNVRKSLFALEALQD